MSIQGNSLIEVNGTCFKEIISANLGLQVIPASCLRIGRFGQTSNKQATDFPSLEKMAVTTFIPAL